VLLTDYDGTLAPFQEERDRAVPYPGVADALQVVAGGGTRTVVITGRPARAIPDLMPLDPRPEIWGSHGLERWMPDGRYRTESPSASGRRALARAEALAESRGLADWLEVKPAGVALHWRGRDDRETAAAREEIEPAWREMCAGNEMQVLAFDGGLELRSTVATKARAVQTVLRETGPGGAVAYLGDDLTDEDAFRALRGRGLGVLVRTERRDTLADAWIVPPDELLGLLARWAESCGGMA
jgi:trehalose-phosphatase